MTGFRPPACPAANPGAAPATRLAVLCGLALLAATGCSSDPSTARLINNATPFDRSAPAPSPVFLATLNAGAPKIIAAVESQPEAIALFVRQTVSDSSGVGSWVGPDGAQLMFDNGMLVGTRGFGGDVLASDISESRALVQSLGAGYATRLMTVIDGEDRAVTRALKCQITPGDAAQVTVGTQAIATRITTEYCRSDLASFTNFYWVVPGSGEIIQSSQWAGQPTGKISLRTVASNQAG